MKPKFKVGEQVILQSRFFPNKNGGPYTISEIRVSPVGKCKCSQTGKILDNPFSYHLEGVSNSSEGVYWTELSLHKYYPPSEFSFKELMQSLTKENV